MGVWVGGGVGGGDADAESSYELWRQGREGRCVKGEAMIGGQGHVGRVKAKGLDERGAVWWRPGGTRVRVAVEMAVGCAVLP